jgi:hypothetical protein
MSIIDTIGDYKLKMNDTAGQIAFGNSVRFSDNFRGKMNKTRYRITSPSPYSPPSEINVGELKKVGFLNLGQPFPEQVVDEAQEAFERAIENEDTSAVRGSGEYEGKEYSKYITNIEENAPVLYEFLNDDILKTVGTYLGSTFKLEEKFDNSYVAAWQNFNHPNHAPNVPVIEKIGSGNWHCDRSQPDRIKLFVVLSDVDEGCGPFHILSKAETKRMVKEHGYTNKKRETMGAPNGYIDTHASEIKRLTGASGTAAFADTVECLHRAGLPEEGRHRNLIQFEFKASSTHITEQIPNLL